MSQLMMFLSTLVSIYTMIIFIRIILTWFSGPGYGGFQEFLNKITDPYLDWFRRFTFLRIGAMDFSPVIALAFLSLVSRFFVTISRYGSISVGIILAMLLQAAWGMLSFFLGLLIILLILRLAAYFFRLDSRGPFWRVVDTYSQPVIFRINRFLFRNRIVNFMTAIILSIVSLGLLYFVLRLVISIVSGMLAELPF